MSDAASVASSLGVPEELVLRSAKARATAGGTTADAVLGAWSGGESVATAAPATAPAAAEPAQPESVEESADGNEAVAPVTAVPSLPAPAPVAQPAAVVGSVTRQANREAAPLLVGRVDHPMLAIAGMVVLFVISALLAVGVPGLDARNAAADQIPGTTPILSDAGLAGRDVYLQQGCMYCHTQQVRTVVTDIGLGPVTEPGTSPAVGPPTLGFVRIGPDLTHIGSRSEDPALLRTALVDPKRLNPDSLMPSYAYLSESDLSALMQFLEDSK